MEYLPLFIGLSITAIGATVGTLITMLVKVAVLKTKQEATEHALAEEKRNNQNFKDGLGKKIDAILSKMNGLELALAKVNPEK